MIKSLALFLLWAVAKSDGLTFGLLNGGSPFFEPVQQGWEQKCKALGVTCHYRVSGNGTCEEAKGAALREFISMKVDGIALKPCGDGLNHLFEEANEAGIPIVTFDSDAPNSMRAAYIGTDNRFLGRRMARLLRQLRPEGGTFAIVSPKAERLEGFMEEIMKDNDRDDRAHWHEVEKRNFSGDYVEQMQSYALLNPSAMITMKQTPMRHPNWTDFVDANRHRGITYVGSDGADYQLSYLNRRYVDGLVGQLPYEIGSTAAQVLYDVATKGTLEKTVFPTNLVAYNLIPLELPPLDVDQNLLGNMKYTGIVCFGVVAVSALACVAWTLYHGASSFVVRAAQPFFLLMIAGGVLLLSSTLVPLSYDDGGDIESLSTTRSIGVCMSIPWLGFTGFTVIFSALFSKTWRVNRLFSSSQSFARVQVSVADVLAPFAVLLACNFVVLICWTVIDPLTYARQFDDGTDFWNREISSYGSCRSDRAAAYLVPLGLINLGALVIACWQAWHARDIQCEFSETKYIGLTVASMTQAFLIGIPIVAVVRDIPEAFYLVLTFMVFILCMVVLALIFLPKVVMRRKYAAMSEADQRKSMAVSVRKSSIRSASFISGLQDASARFGSASALSTMSLPLESEEKKSSTDLPPPVQDGSAGTLSPHLENEQEKCP